MPLEWTETVNGVTYFIDPLEGVCQAGDINDKSMIEVVIANVINATDFPLGEYKVTSVLHNFAEDCAVEIITLPATITSFKGDCFSSASSLKTIYYQGTEAQWNSIEGIETAGIAESVTIQFKQSAAIALMSLADEVRELSGTITSKSIDAMTSDIKEANAEIFKQAELLAQIIAVLESKTGGETVEERLEGDGQEFYTTAPSTLSFRSTAPLNELQDVQINGQTIDPSNYILEEGSTIVKLKYDYLSTLDTGKYEVAIVSDSKTVKGDFTITAPELNKYGFYYNQPYTLEVPMDEEGNVLTMLFLFNTSLSEGDDSSMVGYIAGQSDETVPFTYSVEGSVITAINGVTEETMLFEISSEGLVLDGFGELTFGSSICKSDGNNLYIFNGESYTVRHVSIGADNYSPIQSNISNIPVTHIAAGGYVGVSTKTLNTLIIPEGITHIGAHAFADSSVNNIYLPATLVSIDSAPLNDCAINSITFAGTCAEWDLVEGRSNIGASSVVSSTATYVQCSDGQVAL